MNDVANYRHFHAFFAAVIKLNHMNDSRRSYQCIKFLVSLANRCPMAKDYLMQSSTKWQWAVNWLKKQVPVKLQGKFILYLRI